MHGFDEYVTYIPRDVIIRPDHVSECLNAVRVWTGKPFDGLLAAFESVHHQFLPADDGSFYLDSITLETRWQGLKQLYKIIAPCVQAEARVLCVDDQGQHLCYRFDGKQVFAIEGRVVYDGPWELI